MTSPVVTIASQATRASGSLARIASSTASEIWSASLSGWPSVTDSDVNKDTAVLLESPAPARTNAGCGVPKRQVFSLGTAPRLAERDVVNARVAEKPGTALPQQSGGCVPRRLDHRLDVLALHHPRGGRRGDRAQHHNAGSAPQPLVVAEHLVVQRKLQ